MSIPGIDGDAEPELPGMPGRGLSGDAVSPASGLFAPALPHAESSPIDPTSARATAPLRILRAIGLALRPKIGPSGPASLKRAALNVRNCILLFLSVRPPNTGTSVEE